MYLLIMSFIGIGVGLVWYLLAHDHGRKMSPEMLWAAFGFGLLAVFIAVGLEMLLTPISLATMSTYTLSQRFYNFLGVGFIEEAAKFVPLAIFVYKKGYFAQRTDGVIFFAISGLTFGLGENIMYTLLLGTKAGLLRMALVPFFHVATTSILGYYLVSYKISHSNKAKMILALVLVPLLHGLYDFGLSSGIVHFAIFSIMITVLLSLGFFLYFMQANDLDKAQFVTVAASGGGFCTKCGSPKNSRAAFCTKCGQRYV